VRELFLDSSPGKLFYFTEAIPAEKLMDPAILGLRAATRSYNIDAKAQYVICFGFFTLLAFFRPEEAARRPFNAVLER
jgi:hypothetical protein